MPQNASLNKWGVPDWRNSVNYGDVSSWSKSKWRWEFYRRNGRLREYFDANAEETYEYNLKLYSRGLGTNHEINANLVLRPDQPGFCATVTMESREEFGYSAIPNPRISNQPLNAIHAWMNPAPIFHHAFGKQLIDGKQRFAIDCPVGKLAVVFDLDAPLAIQLKSAKRRLEWEQSERSGKKLQKRRRPENWFIYLRVLDARADSASWNEISEILPDTGDKTPQSARDTWKQAIALCSNF